MDLPRHAGDGTPAAQHMLTLHVHGFRIANDRRVKVGDKTSLPALTLSGHWGHAVRALHLQCTYSQSYFCQSRHARFCVTVTAARAWAETVTAGAFSCLVPRGSTVAVLRGSNGSGNE
jgi:hypothetical protein